MFEGSIFGLFHRYKKSSRQLRYLINTMLHTVHNGREAYTRWSIRDIISDCYCKTPSNEYIVTLKKIRMQPTHLQYSQTSREFQLNAIFMVTGSSMKKALTWRHHETASIRVPKVNIYKTRIELQIHETAPYLLVTVRKHFIRTVSVHRDIYSITWAAPVKNTSLTCVRQESFTIYQIFIASH
jgi:hypothetical protein